MEEIAPVLDDSMSRLRSRDRDALLLRFYQQKSLAEVGAALGVSEGAAKIRILRAIEKLRGLLRRRGVAVPTDALGVALLAHVTHAAPASFVAGCVPASASIKATAISKGVSTMLISTKIKIVAALILISSIPVGTGAYLLVNSVDRPVAPTQSVAPDIAADALQEANSGLDPRVVPFVTDRTDIVIAIDLRKLDLDALGADMGQELFQAKMDAPSTARVFGVMQMALFGGKQWINGFKQAGGTTIYFLSRADELTVNSAAKAPTMMLSGTVVYPTDSPAAARFLARFLTASGSPPLKVVGNAVVGVDKTPSPNLPSADGSPDPRPALATALSVGGDAPIRAAVNPRKLREIVTKCMASGKLGMDLNDEDYKDIEYCSISLVLPPAASPGFVIFAHHSDPASAQKAKDRAIERIGHELKTQPGSNALFATTMENFIKSETFTVKDSDVIGTMDLHAYYRLFFAAISVATQPPTTQPQRAASKSQQPMN